jgi:hypothetical protein
MNFISVRCISGRIAREKERQRERERKEKKTVPDLN